MRDFGYDDHQKVTTSWAGDHDLWIAAARREAEGLRSPCRPAGVWGGSSGGVMVPDPQLRQSVESGLDGYEFGEESFRGGQGVVFRATQKGTRRDVAVKVLREGPRTGTQGVARFEREIQILAQFKHPNIVSILETGTIGGNFYYVMDFIEGWSLDDFIVEHRPNLRERLSLFASICEAVNVAHLRGVIHRDLKPGNVRVDRAGAPHILDFGLAKVSEHDDFAAAMTMTGQFVGSLPWASPEQVEARADGIDIRTDVYSIGVMMYHAMTGSFPYSIGDGFRQTIENICRTDPEAPRSINDELDDEIDQIVLKCLRKDREHRYQSAGNIAKDIRRYLAGEAIEAKRDSGWYVIRKTVKRHRAAATVFAVIMLSLVYAIGSLIYFYDRESALRRDAELARDDARREAAAAADARSDAEREAVATAEARDEARRQSLVASAVNLYFLENVIGVAAPDELGPDVTVRAALDAASRSIGDGLDEDAEIKASVHFVTGNTYMRLGVFDKAEHHFVAARELYADAKGPDSDEALLALNDLASAQLALGKPGESARSLEDCLSRRRRAFGENHEETLSVQANLGWVLANLARYEEAEPLIVGSYEKRKEISGARHEETLKAMNNVALFYYELGRFAEAADISEMELAISRETMPDDSGLFVSMSNLASMYTRLKRYDRAEALYEEALEGRRRVLGETHPQTLLSMNNLATLYSQLGRIDASRALLESALPIAIAEHGESLPLVATLRSNLGERYNRDRRFADAESLHAFAVQALRDRFPDGHPTIGLYLRRYGDCLTGLERYDDAESALLESHDILMKHHGSNHAETREAAGSLVELYERLNRVEAASKWRRVSEAAE